MMQTGKTQDSQLLLLLGFQHGSFLSAGLKGARGVKPQIGRLVSAKPRLTDSGKDEKWNGAGGLLRRRSVV
ncbi:hypothetical protein VB005_07590 [Metarhizium brunneum]